MKTWVRHTILGSLLLLVVAGIVTIVVLAHNRPVRESCSAIRVVIEDEDERQFVSQDEVLALLRSKHLYPVGQALEDVSTSAIETEISQHPMVRHAECYMVSDGTCFLTLTQREPLYRVVTPGESYLIDCDRQRMPIRGGMQLQVKTAEGRIGERMAKEELFDMMWLLSTDGYWHDRIRKVEVVDMHQFCLIDDEGRRLILGSIDNYEEKLNKYRSLCENGFRYMDEQPQCREIDLRFNKQVVTRK